MPLRQPIPRWRPSADRAKYVAADDHGRQAIKYGRFFIEIAGRYPAAASNILEQPRCTCTSLDHTPFSAKAGSAMLFSRDAPACL
jgi:hypothetical protein